MREFVSVNGELMSAAEARVSVFDSGFMQGVGLFETMRAYNGVVFRLRDHVERLIRSGHALGWTVLPEAELLIEDTQRVVGATEQADASVRVTVTTGSLRRLETEAPALTVVVSAATGHDYPPELYRNGVTIVVGRTLQNASDPTCGHKTTSYFSRLSALRVAHHAGAFEALWLTDDELVAEGCISSVFAVEDGALLTPPLNTPVLPGITRAAVLEAARQRGLPTHEAEITRERLMSADEVFLTNSLMEVMPVVRVGREPIGAEKPGELTTDLYHAYGELIQRECADG